LDEAAFVVVINEKGVKVDKHEANEATSAADTTARISEEVYVYRS
jgi:hypothetical protein